MPTNVYTSAARACAFAGRPASRRPWATLAAVGLLCGCGGGGDAGGSGPPPDTGGSPPPAGGGASSDVTLIWTPPTSNVDGSPLTDLAGYYLYYGQTPGVWDRTLDVPASVVSVEIESLAAGSWYFSISSYNTAGVESARSGVVTTTI